MGLRGNFVWVEGHGFVPRDQAKALKSSTLEANPKRSTIYDDVKVVERGSWVTRNGELVPKHLARAIDIKESMSKRSAHPAPMVMSDIQEYKSMIDGSIITSRSQHREHLRQHGCEEVGNETLPTARDQAPAKGEIAQEIKTAIEQLEAGYIDPDLGPTHDSDGNPIVDPDMEPIVLSADTKNGDVIRSDVAPSDA